MLALAADANQIWTAPAHRQVPFLRALVACWDELIAIGRRYTNGSREPDVLWPLVHTVRGVLVRRGIPSAELTMPPSANGLAALVARCRIPGRMTHAHRSSTTASSSATGWHRRPSVLRRPGPPGVKWSGTRRGWEWAAG